MFWIHLVLCLAAPYIIKSSVVVDESNCIQIMIGMVLYYCAGYIHCKSVED